MKTIKVGGAPPKKGMCPKRPSLDGSQGNPMAFCQFKAKHKGKHSWERQRQEGAMSQTDDEDTRTPPSTVRGTPEHAPTDTKG